MRIHICIYIHLCTYKGAAYVRIYIHTYIHTYKHTHTYTYKHRSRLHVQRGSGASTCTPVYSSPCGRRQVTTGVTITS